MELRENVALAPYTTLQVGGPARYFVEVGSEAQIVEALAWGRERKLPLFVLGGGSNLVVSDSGWPGLVVKMGLKGIESSGDSEQVTFRVAAGEDWDRFVALTTERDCGGIECLSGIPGSVGGTPVQNVGAYGQEVAETIVSVRVVDTRSGETLEMSNEECGFAYRTSIFNTTHKGRYIVTSVTFGLHRGAEPKIEYADLKRYFATASHTPTLADARDAVRVIRASKAMLITPSDEDSRSAGSFFKNPIISISEYERIAAAPAARGEAPPKYPAENGCVKTSAAWLVERAGFHKGFTEGSVGISRKHSLAIVNRGGATAAEIAGFKDKVIHAVKEAFGIELHPEPVFVGFPAHL